MFLMSTNALALGLWVAAMLYLLSVYLPDLVGIDNPEVRKQKLHGVVLINVFFVASVIFAILNPQIFLGSCGIEVTQNASDDNTAQQFRHSDTHIVGDLATQNTN